MMPVKIQISSVVLFYLILILLNLEIFAVVQSSDGNNLVMRDDGKPFKIALFADLHFGEDAWTQWGPRQDVNSINVMFTILDKDRPG